MPSPFPGMDPFIESQTDWSSFHTAFMVDISRTLLDILPPDFDARIEAHVSVMFPFLRTSGKPRTGGREADIGVFRSTAPPSSAVAVLETPVINMASVRAPETVRREPVRQTSLKIVSGRGGQESVVAIIEVFSPTNKDGRGGTDDYHRKQEQLLQTSVHLVEIDLLRQGEHIAYVPEGEIAAFGDWQYLVTLRDANNPNEYKFWRIGLQESLPTIALPLTPDVAPVPLDLQEAFTRCYEGSRFARRLDYAKEPEPPLSPEDAAWADALLRANALRP